MSHNDLFSALVPYNYTTSIDDKREHDEEYESKALIEFADVNKDGLISLYEYYFFVIFMQCLS